MWRRLNFGFGTAFLVSVQNTLARKVFVADITEMVQPRFNTSMGFFVIG